MPHAESPTSNGEMSVPATNGDTPHSKVLSHLQTYPVVHDSVEFYKSHPYGAKSLSLFQKTYARFVSPLHPYLQTPYSYLSPYLSRADELGDNGLSKVETKFPIVKEDTNKLKETVAGLAGLPFAIIGQGRDYLLGTWADEYQKTRGDDGLVKSAKALLSTELKIGHDGYNYLLAYLGKAKKEGSKKVDEVKQ
ncbi:CAP20-like protein [Pleomassaria siparia CBS 279.74]|uniref:CAP20-like protein n=1 Tax=Pleomassaria siparia CBS 279.74 TaxID=1314801 RepID=A0A6G1KF67_9PLEO|nr:CAP20-like protein [Pleomassaria siparia CBS 279.74]